jgi:hypothetical protein
LNSIKQLVEKDGWEKVLIDLREEAARQLVLTGDPVARRVYNVLQVCIEEVVLRDC